MNVIQNTYHLVLQDKVLLMIDDEPANLGTLTMYLEGYQVEILVARDGKSGLDKAQHAHPDLILLDVMMPEIDGFETCRLLKMSDDTRDIPVIFMTALTDIADKVRAFQVGAVDYIIKPFQQEEVLARVVTHVRLRELNEHLEQKVRERTAELMETNQRLQQEISERRHAEDALWESEARFRRLAENAQDMIYRMTLPDGRYEYINSFITELSGYAPEEWYASPTLIRQVIHPDWQSYFAGQWEKLLQDEMPPSYEYQIVHKSGDIKWVHQRNVLVRDADGKPIAIEGIVTDITTRKHAEEEIRTLNAELEQRVRERTAKLEAANKELQSFAYVVSHDLKAPLRNIAQLATWLVEDYAQAFDAKGKEYAALLLDRVKRMDNLINGVLEYSRIGCVVGKEEPIDLNALLSEVVDIFAPPPHIRIALQPSLPMIVSDKTRITQVFQNLIGNAIKFMDKPQGEIAVSCADDGASWCFSVTDNGPGIDPKYHDKIFQIFQTLHPRDEVESTGIGLTIVKKIVELYGGKIGIESEIGKGSTFWFTLPKSR
jgi:two-component system, LuxR family, sensor kinase FixL